jgi:2-polyprenyl-3-methyl-5-hydroxy-6-metoxy-1,4-benzoquinol methylase
VKEVVEHRMRAENFDRRWYRFAEEILPEVGTYPRTVELGCGRGEFARLLRDRGFDVTAVDVDSHNVTACQALGFRTEQADLNQLLPFEDDRFDLAVMLEVIEHIPLADRLVMEISRILRRDGLLLLSTPNCAWILYRIQSLLGSPPHNESYHFRFFVQRNLTEMLKSAGLEIVRRNSWTYPFPLLNRFRRLLGQPRVDWHVSERLEPLWASSFVWLVKNTKSIDQAGKYKERR